MSLGQSFRKNSIENIVDIMYMMLFSILSKWIGCFFKSFPNCHTFYFITDQTYLELIFRTKAKCS